MKKLFFIILIFSGVLGFTQTLVKSSLSAGGGSATQGNLHLIYALGEIGVRETDQGSTHLSEGFVGPDITALLGIEDYTKLEGVKIFPNPVQDILNIEITDLGSYEIYLYDMTGKQVMFETIENKDGGQYRLNKFPTGFYLLTIIDQKNKKTITFKLHKL